LSNAYRETSEADNRNVAAKRFKNEIDAAYEESEASAPEKRFAKL